MDLCRIYSVSESYSKTYGCSIWAAMPSTPHSVNAVHITTGIIFHPIVSTSTNGRQRRYSVTHCLRCTQKTYGNGVCILSGPGLSGEPLYRVH